MNHIIEANSRPGPWNKGRLIIWAIRIRLQLGCRVRESAMFNLAIDSKLRSCDLVKLRVRDLVQCLPARRGVLASHFRLPIRHSRSLERPESFICGKDASLVRPPLFERSFARFGFGETPARGRQMAKSGHNRSVSLSACYRGLQAARRRTASRTDRSRLAPATPKAAEIVARMAATNGLE